MRGHVIVGVMTISTDIDKLYDTDLSDAAWALIAPMLPAARPGGRPGKINLRAVLNAIFYLLRTGCQWRLLPREFPGKIGFHAVSPKARQVEGQTLLRF